MSGVVEPLNEGIKFAASASGVGTLTLFAYDVAYCAYTSETKQDFGNCLVNAVLGAGDNHLGGKVGNHYSDDLKGALASLGSDQTQALAERSGMDRKTVRKYLRRGLTAPIYGPREPRPSKLDTFTRYLDQRISHYPELSGARLLREIREMGYTGGYSLVTDYLRDIRFVSVTSKA